MSQQKKAIVKKNVVNATGVDSTNKSKLLKQETVKDDPVAKDVVKESKESKESDHELADHHSNATEIKSDIPINTLSEFLAYKMMNQPEPEFTKDNISKLKIGQTINSYRELCDILSVKEKSGRSKTYQMKELSRFVLLERRGYKFIVLDIYKEPLEKYDERLSIFTKCIEVILMYNLAHPDIDPNFIIANKNSGNMEGCYDFYKSTLWRSLGLVNDNYGMLLSNNDIKDIEDNVDDLDGGNGDIDVACEPTGNSLKKKKTTITEQLLTLFYNVTNRRLTQILEHALNSMKSRFILTWHYQTVIQYQMSVPGISDTVTAYRVANPNEIKEILNIQNRIMLHDFNCKSMFQLAARGKLDDFYKIVNKELHHRFGWDRTFKQIRIISSQEAALRTYPIIADDFLKENRYRLNSEVAKTLAMEATNTYNKSLEKLSEYYLAKEKRKEKVNTLLGVDKDTDGKDAFLAVMYSKINEVGPSDRIEDAMDAANDYINEVNSSIPNDIKKPFIYPETYVAATKILINELIKLEENSSLSDELCYDGKAKVMDINLIDATA